MELGLARPGKRERIHMILGAMHTMDVVNGTYRATSLPTDKMNWLTNVWTSHTLLDWAGAVAPPHIDWNTSKGGTWRFHRTDDGIAYQPGSQAMTDLDLAKMFAYSARYSGLPVGSRQAQGMVHDPSMLMMLTAALWVGIPSRAKEFHDLATAAGLNIAKPSGGWDPKKWA